MYASFQNLNKLEYLDLSFNQIEFVDGRIFGDWGDFKMKPLKYLNLETNRIKHFEETLINLLNLDTFIFTHNFLEDFPNFDVLFILYCLCFSCIN